MKITLVKKILADGSACAKCQDVSKKLEDSGHINKINQIVIADERNLSSEGIKLAALYQVERAPFFIVDYENGTTPVIYTIYLKFIKEVLEQSIEEKDELKEIMQDNPGLDFL